MGGVVHPLNIRLPAEQLIHIARHAGDAYVIVDHSLVPAFATLLPHLEAVRHVIVNGPADLAAPREAAAGVEVHDYHALLSTAADTYDWPDVDERSAAAMCYTSGTTGLPKGVVYNHRSVYLHSVEACLPDAFALSRDDMALAVVPQFHVLAWTLPYAAFVTGRTVHGRGCRVLQPASRPEPEAPRRPGLLGQRRRSPVPGRPGVGPLP
ncbi:AMP-binding protein [Streptomyces sp. AC555_RSS877]|uniref:AMP-binding protein n=1 Tax=Streptomyces sp. AC555_RSS877 TaxID=2823688 RepID=UPI001C2765F4|nr:AMP-binding protein [Streptomyces sp. AC555_RSS877]